VQTISATLEKRVQGSTATIRFDDKPEFSMGCNPLRDFAGIYLNETVKISGVTYLNSLDLAFPSGKKVHFDTEKTEFKYVNGKDVRKFSKTVNFLTAKSLHPGQADTENTSSKFSTKQNPLIH